jgi:sigma-E factor negative regulatory protein RseB
MSRQVVSFGIALALLPFLAWADGGKTPDLDDLWKQLGTAAQQLTYSGVFVFQHDGRMESSRVSHTVENGVEKTRIDTLDGPPREIIRSNDEMRCYFPDSKFVRLEHSNGRHFFPALIAPPYQAYQENYQLSVVGVDRVAGRDCQVILLKPRDNFRFAHQFCSDLGTGLLLRATTLGPLGDPIQMSVFTEITIGSGVEPSQLRPGYADTLNWHVENVPAVGKDVPESGWIVSNLPSGFRKVVEVKRPLPGQNGSMTQLVYSDGLASVSVFIEPSNGRNGPVRIESLPSSLSFYSAHTADRRVTVVGEVPLASVTQMGESVTNIRSSRP